MGIKLVSLCIEKTEGVIGVGEIGAEEERSENAGISCKGVGIGEAATVATF
jgi:hypothetical protein